MRRRVRKRVGIIAFLLGMVAALIAGHAKAEEWKNIGEHTFIRSFESSNGPFTCIMVVGGGGMAGEVKTIACPGVVYVPITKEEPVPTVAPLRRILSESRRLPVLPKQEDAQTPKAPRLD